MMEAVRTFETSVHFNVTTRRYIPEDSELHTRRRDNLKSPKLYYCSVQNMLLPVNYDWPHYAKHEITIDSTENFYRLQNMRVDETRVCVYASNSIQCFIIVATLKPGLLFTKGATFLDDCRYVYAA
jgi:hypothetical protein